VNKIRVMLCDDHAILRAGLRALLAGQENIEVVGETCTGEEAVERARELSPDVVVMDAGLPGIDGLEATRRIRAGAPGCRVLLLTMHSQPELVLAASKAGASGYVLKSDVDVELVRAIRLASVDEAFIYSAGTRAALQEHIDRGGRLGEPSGLSRMQLHVVQLIAEGKSAQEIAGLLHLSTSTVYTYSSRVMKKLGLRRRAELIQWALQHKDRQA